MRRDSQGQLRGTQSTQVSGHSLCQMRHNPSFKGVTNGRLPGPVWRYAVHFLQSGLGVLLPSPACLERNHMRAFAYPSSGPLNEFGLLALKEFSISADAATVRALAEFMLVVADKMDLMGAHFGHMHAQDVIPDWDDSWPDLVIGSPAEE